MGNSHRLCRPSLCNSNTKSAGPASAEEAVSRCRDYTQVPTELDAAFDKLDRDNALRPTIIKAGDVWTKKSQKALLAQPSSESLYSDEQKKEKEAAFDLLDALTKSGALSLEH